MSDENLEWDEIQALEDDDQEAAGYDENLETLSQDGINGEENQKMWVDANQDGDDNDAPLPKRARGELKNMQNQINFLASVVLGRQNPPRKNEFLLQKPVCKTLDFGVVITKVDEQKVIKTASQERLESLISLQRFGSPDWKEHYSLRSCATLRGLKHMRRVGIYSGTVGSESEMSCDVELGMTSTTSFFDVMFVPCLRESQSLNLLGRVCSTAGTSDAGSLYVVTVAAVSAAPVGIADLVSSSSMRRRASCPSEIDAASSSVTDQSISTGESTSIVSSNHLLVSTVDAVVSSGSSIISNASCVDVVSCEVLETNSSPEKLTGYGSGNLS